MCIGFWTLTHPNYSLVLCTNRDEFLWRPTLAAHWHEFETSEILSENGKLGYEKDTGDGESEDFVLSGIDALAGGTWFGMNRHGNISLLTNITGPKVEFTSSRGHLCASFLLRKPPTSKDSALHQYVEEMIASETPYAGFNLLLLAPGRTRHPANNGIEGNLIKYNATILSNDGAGKPIRSFAFTEKSGGCGCISNNRMSTTDPFTRQMTDKEWPKVVHGRRLFSEVLSRSESESEDALVEQFFNMLREKAHSPPKTHRDLQDTIMVDAINLQNQQDRSSLVQYEQGGTRDVETRAAVSVALDDVSASAAPNYYATRLSSVLLIRKDGTVLFVERDVWISGEDGQPVLVEQNEFPGCHERKYSFKIC